MSRGEDYLYDLLSSVHRMRDEELGGPLRALLRVLSEQVDLLEDDIDRLYDNWFIETCEDWVVPYIGDLVGYEPLADAGLVLDPTTTVARRRVRALVPRRDVAQTIANRRRKGTAALLEELAAGTTGWPARVLELYALLGWTQHLDHQHHDRARTVDLREGDRLDRLSGSFDDLARVVDVRRPVSRRTRGRASVTGVALDVWRLGSYPVTGAPAHCIEREGTHCYTFSVLGNDTPLFTAPVPEPGPEHVAEEANVPTPIRRRAFEHRLSEHPLRADASPAYYGRGASAWLSVQDWPRRGRGGVVPAERVIPADLSDWHAYRAPRDHVLVDPERGRLVFPSGQLPRRVSVGYHYGFSADMGGGEYARQLSGPVGATVLRVRQRDRSAEEHRTIEQAWRAWRTDRTDDGADGVDGPRAVVIEVMDSGAYEERLVLDLEPGEYVQLRAASGCRPVLRLLDYRVDQPDPFRITGGPGSRFVLDGLLVTGRGLLVTGRDHGVGREGDHDREDDDGLDTHDAVDDLDMADDDAPAERGDPCDVTVRHCTLVPGWDLDCDCTPGRPEEPSITLDRVATRLVVEHSIIGAVVVDADERTSDPAVVTIADSIVDATEPGRLALSSKDGLTAYALASLVRTTVVGEVLVHAVDLVENSILVSPLRVARRQVGCVRHSYLAPGSRTPRRYACQPAAGDEERVRPDFTTLRYGRPGYGQLFDPVEQIWRGADDGAELGAFHDLYQPQRVANLRTRLDDYTPAGHEAGIFFAIQEGP